ncbi:MAG: TlpA family protein disulfide reductase [Chloroflexota bacterium]
MKRRVAVACGLVVLLIGVSLAYRLRPPAIPTIGQAAPDFRLRTLAGPEVSLSGYRGHPVLINFWATWCQPCEKEMPELQATAASHSGLVVLGVDDLEATGKVQAYVRRLGLTFPILLDQDGTVLDRYRVVGKPTSLFVDRQGIVRATYLGALPPRVLQRNLRAIGA